MARHQPKEERLLEAHVRLGGALAMLMEGRSLYAEPGHLLVAQVRFCNAGHYLSGRGPLTDSPRLSRVLYTKWDEPHLRYVTLCHLRELYGSTNAREDDVL